MQDEALNPLDLVKYSALKELTKEPALDIKALAVVLEDIAQQAAGYINADIHEEFLYKNPNGWQRHLGHNGKGANEKMNLDKKNDSGTIRQDFFPSPNSSTSSEESRKPVEPWALLGEFDFHSVVRQLTQFIQSWDLTPATKFVLIAQEKCDIIEPFGERYYVEAHFSKPTPKCPNPLAVAKVYFQINVSKLLPRDYPINVTYKFESHKSRFYALGSRKISSNVFQRYLIDSVLHMKLSFYAEMEECRKPRYSSAEEKGKKINKKC